MSESDADSTPRWLRGSLVALRPIEPGDFALLHQWQNEPAMAGRYDLLWPASLADFQRRYVDQPALGERLGALLVVRQDGAAVGRVSYHEVGYGRSSPAFNIGILIAPEHRHQGFGAEAQRLLADYLLATYRVGRVEAGTDVENVAEQRALERAGFQREGIARSASWRAGRWHDVVVYSRVQGDR